jgi:hypothetical protein
VQSSLSPWHGLLQTYSIGPSANAEQQFKSIFGTEPALILVRPDGYAAFTGSDDSVDSLASSHASTRQVCQELFFKVP